MKNQIHIYRSLPLNADSRVLRYQEIYKNFDITFYSWEDESVNARFTNNYKNIPFPFLKGGNRISKTIKLIIFQFWTFLNYIKSKSDSVHLFMDIDTCILIFPFFKFKKTIIDIVDPISQTKFANFPSLKTYIDSFEFFIAKSVNKVILPHKIRLDYYEYLNKEYNFNNIQIIENVPFFENPIIPKKSFEKQLVIGYFGTLDKDNRGLEYLLKFVAKNLKFRLIIGGRGALEKTIQAFNDEFQNISFIGKFNHNDLPYLVSDVNFYWSYYSPNLELHNYAIPNKFYEHLQLDLPIIVSKIIPQSDFIYKNKTGIVIENLEELSYVDFENKLENYLYTPHKIVSYWDLKYKNYYDKIEV